MTPTSLLDRSVPAIRRLPTRSGPGLLIAIGIALSTVVVAAFFVRLGPARMGFGGYRIDLDVYRLGTRRWLDGGALYGPLPRTQSGAKLLFTYPPATVLMFLPLAALHYGAANVALTCASIAAVTGTCWLYLKLSRPSHLSLSRPSHLSLSRPSHLSLSRPSHLSLSRPSRVPLIAVLPAALLLEPVRDTLMSGQVNAVLMGLVAWDCLAQQAGRAEWQSGWLVGVAAAVKLTPAVFVLFFVLRRDWASVSRMAGGFLACTAAAFVVDPATSVQYWSSIVFQTGRIGPPQYAANQSLLGVLARLGVTGSVRTHLWLGLSAVVLAVAVVAIRTALRQGQLVTALSVNALAGLLISPISWSHHWVWTVPALLSLAVTARPAYRSLAGAGIALLAVSPQGLLPRADNRELHWNWWQQLAGSSYCLAALLALIVLALPRLARPEPSVIACAELVA